MLYFYLYIEKNDSHVIILNGGVLVSTWKRSTSGMRRTSVGLLNHPINKVNDESELDLRWLLKA